MPEHKVAAKVGKQSVYFHIFLMEINYIYREQSVLFSAALFYLP